MNVMKFTGDIQTIKQALQIKNNRFLIKIGQTTYPNAYLEEDNLYLSVDSGFVININDMSVNAIARVGYKQYQNAKDAFNNKKLELLIQSLSDNIDETIKVTLDFNLESLSFTNVNWEVSFFNFKGSGFLCRAEYIHDLGKITLRINQEPIIELNGSYETASKIVQNPKKYMSML